MRGGTTLLKENLSRYKTERAKGAKTQTKRAKRQTRGTRGQDYNVGSPLAGREMNGDVIFKT